MVSFAQAERSALHGLVPGRHGASVGAAGIVIGERTDLSFASVIAKRGKRDALISAVETAYGVALPQGPRRATRGAVTFAGTGPDQWIASAEGADAQNFAARLRSRIGLFAAVSDQSDARLALRLSGPRVRDVLAKGVPLDLHPNVFKPGDVATTLVAYIGVQIDRLDDATFQLTAPRSMAGSFWSWLSASAAEFGYDVVTRGSPELLP
jgi:sarcosine oxidase subunit gamma